MQWKKYEFPVLVDSLNLVGLSVVPVPILVDEHGIIRSIKPSKSEIAAFVATRYSSDLPKIVRPKVDPRHAWNGGHPDRAATRLTRGTTALDRLIQDYRKIVFTKARPTVPVNRAQDHRYAQHWFGLGVAARRRAESSSRRDGDFALAFECWSRALAIRPGQYIWRRRLQQYGPQESKPYPFYDWVNEANKEIVGRGEQPVKLSAPLTDSERLPRQKRAALDAVSKNPDPAGKVLRDRDRRIKLGAGAAPSHVSQGGSTRVHFEFDCSRLKWDLEGGPIVIWIDGRGAGWSGLGRTYSVPATPSTRDDSKRRLEIEIAISAGAQRGRVALRGFALIPVCDQKDGTCQLIRKDFSVDLTVTHPRLR